jgi:hypothetical protein
MPNNPSNVSSDVFDFLKNRFELTNTTDKYGKAIANPEEMEMFTFDYVTAEGESLGPIVISLLDDNESSNSLKIYYGKDVADADHESNTDFYEFLNDLRQFSKAHMLGFDVRDINRTRLTRKDITPVSEGVHFGPLSGTIKTSIQPLENLKIIIKHSDRVDPKAHNARSRKIERLYIANNKGERFLLPFKSLKAARAMARHLHNGGIPYDLIGSVIIHLVDEAITLSKFLRKVHRNPTEEDQLQDILNAIEGRHKTIKNQLMSLGSQGGYLKHKEEMASEPLEFDDVDESLIRRFNLDDDIMEESLPYISKIYSNMAKKPKEQVEFDNWIKEGHIDTPTKFGTSSHDDHCQCGHFFKEHRKNGKCSRCNDCDKFVDSSEQFND